jgi:hypothetical protein
MVVVEVVVDQHPVVQQDLVVEAPVEHLEQEIREYMELVVVAEVDGQEMVEVVVQALLLLDI